MATTWRVDLRAAFVAILEEQSTATPTLLRKVYPNRPASFGETPAAYVSNLPERITHDAGTRTRTSAPEVVLVDTYRDNQQTGDLLDQLVDLLVDRFDLPANVQRIPNTIIELASITDTDIEVVGRREDAGDKSVLYRGVILGFGEDTAIMEGRQ
jgi:hypothetical protein